MATRVDDANVATAVPATPFYAAVPATETTVQTDDCYTISYCR